MAKEGNIAIDGKIRKDVKYPVGFMDIVTLVKSKVSYRMLYDCKGRFGLKKLTGNESEYKLCKVKSRAMGPKGIPHIITHDGRTIRFPDPTIKTNDTVKINLRNGEITDIYKFEVGCTVMISKGNNIGRFGSLIETEKHEGSYDIIYLKDPNGLQFATRITNAFVIGSNKPEITLLSNHNYLTINQEKGSKGKRRHKQSVVEEEAES